MTAINRFLAVALCAALCIAGTRVYDAYSATASARYTLREQVKLRHHHCTEDEYMFVPSKHVSSSVNYNTPDRAFCVAIELIRRAPHN